MRRQGREVVDKNLTLYEPETFPAAMTRAGGKSAEGKRRLLLGRIKCRELSAARKIRKQRKVECERESADLIASSEGGGARCDGGHNHKDEEAESENSDAEFWSKLESTLEMSARLHCNPVEPEKFRRGPSKPSRVNRLMASRSNVG